MAGERPLGCDLALCNPACDIRDQTCKPAFDPGMDVKESSCTGGAASELLGSFTLLASTLCCDVVNILVVGFLSKPDGESASVGCMPQRDRKPYIRSI